MANEDSSKPSEPSPATDSQPPTMKNVDIATDGDVIFVLEQTRLRVSSAVISNASPVFKAMFGPHFGEGQAMRSAAQPKEVPLIDDDLAAFTNLCRLLHLQRVIPELSHDQKSLDAHAKELFDLAVLADKYGCTESIQMTSGYLLFNVVANAKPKDTPLAATLYLIATAFLMHDDRHFTLFTRRLVMDYTESYSAIAQHPALTMLPSLFLLLVEEQRQAVWLFLHHELTKIASGRCTHQKDYINCQQWGTDYSIWAALIAKMPSYRPNVGITWPPSGCSLRSMLKETYGCGGGVYCQLAFSCGHTSLRIEIPGARWRNVCDITNKVALGLCLDCLQATAEELTPAKCTHHQLLERWADNDPFI